MDELVKDAHKLDLCKEENRIVVKELNDLVIEYTAAFQERKEAMEIGAGPNAAYATLPTETIDELKETLMATTEQFISVEDINKDQYSEADIPKLRAKWLDYCSEILQGTQEGLPPLREINHKIPLIDESKRYNYYMPRCPDSMREQLIDRIGAYTKAKWWEPCTSDQAAPMLCVPKKDNTLRCTIDCRKRNENTVKDVTPFPDQDTIRYDVARAKYRSKIDLSNAYEQVRNVTEDVWKTAFATVFGTFVSNVMQQGDCNTPSTFQRLMTVIFQECLGRFVHVYLDDIFVFSDTIDDHEQHLKIVFDKLKANQLYLKASKVQLYAEKVDCLGHIIDNAGVHADMNKLAKIREWRVPRNYNDIQKFLGVVNYVAHYLPDVTAYTTPLSEINKNNQPFFWRPIHDLCFQSIKDLACRTPILRPIDARVNEPIWVICDASITGIGAMYGQGPTWQSCRPAGFMSKKFTDTQRNYRVFETETLAILEALLKWEDKLVGYRIHVVTDHKALEFFKTQHRLSARQMRWMEYLSRFDCDITYIKGIHNKVADALSRYYESDTPEDKYDIAEYTNADVRLDNEGEDLPIGRLEEYERMLVRRESSRLKEMKERKEERDIEAAEMEQARAEKSLSNDKTTQHTAPELTVLDAVGRGDDLVHILDSTQNDFQERAKEYYTDDPLFSKILENPEDHPRFEITGDSLIWTSNGEGEKVLCIPKSPKGKTSLRGLVLEQGHLTVGHFGPQKTSSYIRRWFWWPKIHGMVHEYCKTCQKCHEAKGSYQAPSGKLHPLAIPTRPWQSVSMDFIGPFPEVNKRNYLWVVVCRLTSQVHLIPIHTTNTAADLSQIYLQEIVRLHGLPESIVSDRDSKFTAAWWRELHRLLGVKLLMSTSYHPQTDGLTERTNRSVAQIFRSSIRPDQGDWLGKCPIVEFAINASISESTGYAPFELTYGYIPSMMREVRYTTNVPPGVRAFASQAMNNLYDAHDALIAARVFQTHYSNRKRRNSTLR